MNKALRVVAADDESELLDVYRVFLASLGHEVVATANNGEQLVELCQATRPDLVITDIKMPSKDGVEAVLEAFRAAPMRVILVTGYHAPDHIHSALGEMVLAYLSKPFQRRELELAIDRADHRFEEFQALLNHDGDAHQAVRDRDVLRLAKGILMKRTSVSDREAFYQLRQMAEEKHLRLAEMAQTVVDAERSVQSPAETWQRGTPITNCL